MEKKLVEGLENFLEQDIKLVKCTCPGKCPVHGGGAQPEYGVPPVVLDK